MRAIAAAKDGYAVGGGGVVQAWLAARSIEIPRHEEWPGKKHKSVEFIRDFESASASVEVNARSDTRSNTNEASRPVSSGNGIPRAAKTERPTAKIRVSATRVVTNGHSDVCGHSDLSRTKAIYRHVIHVIGAYLVAITAEWESRKR
jgi:hypothetical protein